MTRRGLERLLPAARARYEAELSSVRDIIAAENRCRRELARLDDIAAKARAESMRPGPMQVLGADLLFQKSLTCNRARLNAELARILARKVGAMDRVRLAFGRQCAVETTLHRLMADDDIAKKDRERAAALEPWLNRAAED